MIAPLDLNDIHLRFGRFLQKKNSLIVIKEHKEGEIPEKEETSQEK